MKRLRRKRKIEKKRRREGEKGEGRSYLYPSEEGLEGEREWKDVIRFGKTRIANKSSSFFSINPLLVYSLTMDALFYRLNDITIPHRALDHLDCHQCSELKFHQVPYIFHE